MEAKLSREDLSSRSFAGGYDYDCWLGCYHIIKSINKNPFADGYSCWWRGGAPPRSEEKRQTAWAAI